MSERRGTALIVSTKNEMRYLHHYYAFKSLTVRVPTGVLVVPEARTLTGDGAPDLHYAAPFSSYPALIYLV